MSLPYATLVGKITEMLPKDADDFFDDGHMTKHRANHLILGTKFQWKMKSSGTRITGMCCRIVFSQRNKRKNRHHFYP